MVKLELGKRWAPGGVGSREEEHPQELEIW